MKKKIIAIALVIAMVFTLAACGETTNVQKYTVNGQKIDAFDYSGAKIYATLKKGTLGLSPTFKFADGGIAYIYAMENTNATKAIKAYADGLAPAGSSFFTKYLNISDLTNVLPSLTGKLDISKLTGYTDITFLYNISAANAILIAKITVGNYALIVVVPDLVEGVTAISGVTDWISTIKNTIDFGSLFGRK